MPIFINFLVFILIFAMLLLVTEAVIVYDRAKKKSRGYGFVTFSDLVSVPLALKHPIHFVDGRETEVRMFVICISMCMNVLFYPAFGLENIFDLDCGKR